MGLIALVLAALIVAAALALWWALHRRASDAAATAPRTVADLVRLRAEQAATELPAADEADPAGPQDAGVEAWTEAAPPEPVVVRSVAALADTERPAASDAVAAPVPPPAPAGSDTPWGRGARMTEGDGAVWATGEPDPDEPVLPARPAFRPVALPAVNPDLFGTRAAPPPVPDPVAVDAPARPVLALVPDDAPPAAPATDAPAPDARPEEEALRRRSPAEIAAEQAAADLALLRTFGCAPVAAVLDDGHDDEDDAPLSPAVAPVAPPPVAGAAQLVAFRVVGRDGDGIEGARVTLLDDQGRETSGAKADAKGRGEVRAAHPGSYVLVSAAPGHQPGAVAITVADRPVEADVLLARSASVAGTVTGEDGPVVGARLTLVQDGEIVDTTGSGPAGEYWIADLAAGDYGLSVTAAECEPVAVLLTVPDETDVRHDVELLPAGLPAAGSDDGVMIGQP